MTEVSFTEALIDNVKMYPWLYDTSRKDFKNSVKKENSWREIARSLNSDAKTCLEKWTYLRSMFSRKRKAAEDASRNGSEASHLQKWLYFDQMTFFSPFVHKKNLKRTFNQSMCQSQDESRLHSDSEALQPVADICETPEAFVDYEFVCCEDSTPEAQFVNNVSAEANAKLTNGKSEFQERLQSIKYATNILRDYTEDELFFLSLAKRVNRFPLNVKDRIKLKFMEIIIAESNE